VARKFLDGRARILERYAAIAAVPLALPQMKSHVFLQVWIRLAFVLGLASGHSSASEAVINEPIAFTVAAGGAATPAPPKQTEAVKPGSDAPTPTTPEKKAPGKIEALPPDLKPLALEANSKFDRGNYPEAEKLYRQILEKAPDNLYTLTNLGVVLFRERKNKWAEEILKKALAVAP